MIVTFIFVALFCRLAYLQVFNAKTLQIRASEQWLRDLPLKATRGNILDSNGVVLATSYSTYDVYVRANSVEDTMAVTNLLSTALSIDKEIISKKVTNKKVSEVLIKMQVDETLAESIIQANLKGIYLSINNKRYYPYGNMLSQVLGYTTIDNIGQAGIENYYNGYLTGIDGQILNESDVRGKGLDNTLSYYYEPISGLDAMLTIDFEIQNALENVLEQAKEEQKAKNVIGIVMDVNSSGILALSCKDSFDLNNIPRDDLEKLNTLTKNLAITDVFEPGSTFKLFTLAIALELGLTNENERFYCPGYRVVDGQRIKCWKTIGHGSQTLTEGVCNSCNCVFMDLAQRIGVSRFYKGIKDFGFGAKTGVDFYAESSGILMKESNVKTVDLARNGFGHAVAVTPLQLINGVSAIVNGGMLNTPSILKSINKNGQSVYSRVLNSKQTLISSKTSTLIRTMMKAVVDKSNGANAQVTGYSIGGKTGTAQKYENGVIAQGKYVGSFVGFGPYENPKYAVLILVDEPSNGAYYGSIVAAPYAKTLYSKIFDLKGIPANGSTEESLTIQMPNLVGESLAKAISTLKKLGLNYEIDGEGTTVASQFPIKGTMLKENAVVLINT